MLLQKFCLIASMSQKAFTFKYIADLERYEHEKPYRINDIELDPEDDINITNIEFESHETVVHSLSRGHNTPAFERCGFKYIDFDAKTVPGYTDDSILAYCNEMVELIQKHVHADKVLCYDLRVYCSPAWTELS